jgi:microcin C transport system ATP-binding protein
MTSAPLLEVRNLSVSFLQGGRETIAVDRVSFSLERGKTLALGIKKKQAKKSNKV